MTLKRLSFILLVLWGNLFTAQAQSSYIVEQLGRNEHQIVQSLGAFVGNERAESQSFEITFMPNGNNVEGRMIINTADYRCTFRMSVPKNKDESQCFKIEVIVRSADFLRDFLQLFQSYPTTGTDAARHVTFGNQKLLVQETKSNPSGLPRTYVISEE